MGVERAGASLSRLQVPMSKTPTSSIKLLVATMSVFPLIGCQNMQTGQSLGSAQSTSATQSAHSAGRVSTSQSMAARPAKADPVPAAPAPRVAAAPAPQASSADDAMVPPNAKPGECYARVILPPVYETVTEQVVEKEAGQLVEVIPAVLEEVEQRVLVKEASERLEVVPAAYKTVTERVLVKPATTKLVEIPAEYKTVSEQVMVKPAHSVWKKGSEAFQKVDGATGEIMCLVEVPAEFKTVERQVLVAPASTRTVEVPAEYKEVEKTVLVSGPTTRKVVIPAEYDTVTVTRVKVAEQKRVTPIPATYKTITRTVVTQPSRQGWQRILCDTNMDLKMMVDLQLRLTAKGYDAGPAIGRLTDKTREALTAFQQANGLATGGITYETLAALGMIAP